MVKVYVCLRGERTKDGSMLICKQYKKYQLILFSILSVHSTLFIHQQRNANEKDLQVKEEL